MADAGLRTTGTTLQDIEVQRRVSASSQGAVQPGGLKRPEQLAFADRKKLFQADKA
jgi:hypothetical protein